MTFDSDEHKNLVKELIMGASFPGNLVPLVYSLIKAVEKADVKSAESP